MNRDDEKILGGYAVKERNVEDWQYWILQEPEARMKASDGISGSF